MKQAIVVRKDLKMGCGKIAGQVAHASLRAYWATPEEDRNKWKYKYNETKIVLKVRSQEEIIDLTSKAKELKVPYAVVFDAGKTQIEPNTMTAVGIGPHDEEIINEIVGDLKLL